MEDDFKMFHTLAFLFFIHKGTGKIINECVRFFSANRTKWIDGIKKTVKNRDGGERIGPGTPRNLWKM